MAPERVPPTQEVRIQPVVIRAPETTHETTYIERIVEQPVERHTDKLQVVTPPPAAAPETKVIVITQPGGTHEPPVRTQDPTDGNTRSVGSKRTDDPISKVPLAPVVSELPPVAPQLETGTSAKPEQTEVKAPEVPQKEPGTSTQPEAPEHETEEKTSARKKKLPPDVPQTPETGTSGDKLKVYSGKGRRHTDEQIDEILDEYLQYGNLPKYVSDRQRRDYRKHKRLELRRLYLEQAGLIVHGIESGN